MSKTEIYPLERYFLIDYKRMDIIKKSTHIKLGISVGTKRIPVYNEKNEWVNTKPIYVHNLSKFNSLGVSLIKYMRYKEETSNKKTDDQSTSKIV